MLYFNERQRNLRFFSAFKLFQWAVRFKAGGFSAATSQGTSKVMNSNLQKFQLKEMPQKHVIYKQNYL